MFMLGYLTWWFALFIVGWSVFLLTRQLFESWEDQGYLLAKSLGLASVTFITLVLSFLHLSAFGLFSIVLALGLLVILSLRFGLVKALPIKQILISELIFTICLFSWIYVKAHEPSIRGLEKFMDYGFTQTILNTKFFPPKDMWYAGDTNFINYYYFGHSALAILTILSQLPLSTTFNLMLCTLFAFTFSLSYAISKTLTKSVWASILTAFIVALGGNLQTIYAYTTGYQGKEDAPPPFWQILTGKIDPNYWYANATRFIPFAIHEFPSYSFVVSDVHGHVLSLPFVLLAFALLITIFIYHKVTIRTTLLYGFVCGVLLMTNALDGPIYAGIFAMCVFFYPKIEFKQKIFHLGLLFLGLCGTSLMFLINFKSFVTGLAVNCPPAILANQKFGPILFEGIEKCQRSSWWMLIILWGFFVYCVTWLLASLNLKRNTFFAIVVFCCAGLIGFAEVLYFKDIYPQHFRSNTMFKLGYQAFIMLGILSGFTIHHVATRVIGIKKYIFLVFLTPLLFLILIYPLFSVPSYFGKLGTKDSLSLDGLNWLKSEYSDNWQAIQYLNLVKQDGNVLVEADGDSYTDYNQVSAFTGIPTIVGWAVHEWLWRGSYDVVAPKRNEVREIYESGDLEKITYLIKKYKITYIYVGTLERKKFINLTETVFPKLASPVFKANQTTVWKTF